MNSTGGEILYLTGGTTATPRIVRYSRERWKRSVGAKRRLLERWNVTASSRVAVCHPMAPWAIGHVFSEAALEAGGTVLPLGLTAQLPAFSKILREFEPTHICASAANLIGWANALGETPLGVKILFVAGEKLTIRLRTDAERAWSARVVDIYGMAEFDMVAAELPGANGLSLVAHLTARLRVGESGDMVELAPGRSGELCLREADEDPWFRSGDAVSVVDYGDFWNLGTPVPAISFLTRLDGAICFSDGAMLSPIHMSHLAEAFPSLQQLQAVVCRRIGGDVVELRGVRATDDERDVTSEMLVTKLLELAVDLADSYKYGCVAAISCKFVNQRDLIRTDRGKIPLVCYGDSNDEQND